MLANDIHVVEKDSLIVRWRVAAAWGTRELLSALPGVATAESTTM